MLKHPIFIVFCFIVFVSGCGPYNHIALKKGQNNIDTSKESVVLVSVKLSNQFKINHQPGLYRAAFVDNSNRMIYIEIDQEPYKSIENQYNEYLLSFSLKPGKYVFAFLIGYSRNSYFYTHLPFFATGTCDLFIDKELVVKPNSVVYIGKIDAVIRKRKNDSEVRAGDVGRTYIGQSLAGFSTGTFDIEIKDNYDEDMKRYLAEYPGLQKVKIEKSVLSPWEKPALPSSEFFRSQILGL